MIDFAKYKRLDIPEGRAKAITRKSDGLLLWKAGYVNEVPQSVDENGGVYNGAGYKENYRLSSDGSEKTGTNGIITGFIPVKPGDVIRVASIGKIINWPIANATNCIHYYDSGKESVGRFMGAGTVSGVCTAANSAVTEEVYRQRYRFIVPDASSIIWVRVGIYCPNGPVGADLIVTVNEEIV